VLLAWVLLVVADNVDDGVAAQLLGAIAQMDERREHRPAASRSVGLAEGIGFAIGDDVAEGLDGRRRGLTAEIEGNVAAELLPDLGISHEFGDAEIVFNIPRLGTLDAHQRRSVPG
jgi:hypothetical protein